jgi:predicted chitinase
MDAHGLSFCAAISVVVPMKRRIKTLEMSERSFKSVAQFFKQTKHNSKIMENLLYNLNSVEISYGDNALNTIIQIEERITDIAEAISDNDDFTDFEKAQVRDRLEKLVEVNENIQKELEKQVHKLKGLQGRLNETKLVL